MKNTLIYAVVTVLLSNVVGLAVAMILNTKIHFKGLFRTCAYFPALFSAIVVGFIWSYVYMPGSGMIASLLSMFGMDGAAFNPLGNYKTALYAIAIVEAWKAFGTTMIIYLAGLQNIPKMYQEAALLDGATKRQIFFKVKLPLLMPAVTTAVITNLIGGFKLYDIIVTLTNGGPNRKSLSLSYYISLLYFSDEKAGYSSAVGIALFVIIFLVAVPINHYLRSREVEY